MADAIAQPEAETFLKSCGSKPAPAASAQELELARQLRLGEEPAYELLISEYQAPVYNLVFRLLKDPSEASDVVQEVFLKVFRNIEQFRGQSTLKTWIYRIAVNETYNYKRWFWRHRRQEVELEEDPRDGKAYLAIVPDSGPSPFDYLLDREQQQIVTAALNQVKEPYRAAVVLRDIEGLSYEEIAQILNVNMGTVKSRILRGRECLRQELTCLLQPQRARELAPRSLERAV